MTKITPKIGELRLNPDTKVREIWIGEWVPDTIDMSGKIAEKNPPTPSPKVTKPKQDSDYKTGIEISRPAPEPQKRSYGKLIAIALVVAAIIGIVIAISSIPAPLGSEENPYLIYDGEDLQNIICGDDSVHYALANDIDLSEYPDWEPIFGQETFLLWTEEVYFEGTLDGRGHTITGLKCTDGYAGLFKCLEGTVKNLNIEDAYIVAETFAAGILAGWSYKSTVSDCKISGTVTGKSQGSIGGIIGDHMSESTIIRSSFTGTISGAGTDSGYHCSYTSIGGIVGDNSGVIRDSSFRGTISSSDGTAYYTGGIAGSVHFQGEIYDCSVSGSITGDGYVGGIAGWVDGGKVINCKSSGYVQAASLGHRKFATVAGIVAYLEGSKDYVGTVQGCSTTASISSRNTTESGQIVASIGDYGRVI